MNRCYFCVNEGQMCSVDGMLACACERCFSNIKGAKIPAYWIKQTDNTVYENVRGTDDSFP